MSKKRVKRRIGLAKGEIVSAVQVIVIAFVVAGCIMLLLGNQKLQRYKNLKNIDDVTINQLQENMYVKGKIESTLCCYGSYDLYDCYVVPMGQTEDEGQQYITIYANNYDSVRLDELPTTDYVQHEVGMGKRDIETESIELFGMIKKLPDDAMNYEYLQEQLKVEGKEKVAGIVSDAYYIQFAEEEGVKYGIECGITLLFCGLVLYIFFVVPSYRKKVVVGDEEEYRNPKLRKETKQKVTNSIQRFIENVYDDISVVLIEHCGKIATISNDVDISIILNCFVHAKYDKVYEEYVDQDELYTIEFVMNNGESIEGALNGENIIFWYGSLNRIDHISCSKIKKIFRAYRL